MRGLAKTKRIKNKKQPLKNIVVVPKENHPIVQSHISKNALSVINRLREAGHQAYIVGGSVRDLLIGLQPKDFDIATNAHPETVHRLFRNSRLIGRRFKLVHVFFGREIIEVATFRAQHPEASHPDGHRSATGMLVRDNIYGSMEEDAWRRDFSINALYFDAHNFSVIDHTGGMEDLAKGIIRILGDPVDRYKEDPVRMIRALRIAAKLNFKLDAQTSEPIETLSTELLHVSNARLFEELLKLFYSGHAAKGFQLLREYGLFAVLFPLTEATLNREETKAYSMAFIEQSCKNTDTRLAQKQSLNPAFLMAVLLWPPIQGYLHEYREQGHKPYGAMLMASTQVLNQQVKLVAIPKRYSVLMKEIWMMQAPLEQRLKRRIAPLFIHTRFRAAFDFLSLRYAAGETTLKKAVNWWKQYQNAPTQEREKMLQKIGAGAPKK